MEAHQIKDNSQKRNEKYEPSIAQYLRAFRIEAAFALADREEQDWFTRNGREPLD